MDASQTYSGKRYVLLDNELADMIEAVNTDNLRMLLEMLMCASDHKCSCGIARLHTITATDGKQLHLIGRLRNKDGGFM